LGFLWSESLIVLIQSFDDFRFSSKIPITFMVGFYVANVVSRYWDQFISLPWPDRIAYKLVAYIPGQVGSFNKTRPVYNSYEKLKNMHSQQRKVRIEPMLKETNCLPFFSHLMVTVMDLGGAFGGGNIE
jgi:hypothetical protein